MHLESYAAAVVERAQPRAALGLTTAATSASAPLLARMLDAVDYGILLVCDGDGVAFANRCARAELQQGHPLQLSGQRLTARHPHDAVPLREALEGAQCRGLQRLLTLGTHLKQSTGVAVLPHEAASGAGPAHAIVMLGKRAVCGELSAEAFARHHGLTPAELRVLKQLCAGQQAAEIARLQGVALTTVRTQICSIREKTGAANIGDLVRSVARLPPLMGRQLMATGPEEPAIPVASPARGIARQLHGTSCPGPRPPRDSHLILQTFT